MSRTADLKARVEALPDQPGIYFFKDAGGEIIYIGKARSLRDRVKSYFQPTDDPKVRHILSKTADIDFILTGSEKEAFFLENNFIQKHRPKFNLRLKDDKSFPYLKLTVGERFPGVYLCRRVDPDGARYFGPFSPARNARTAIHILNKHFGVRGCNEAVPGKRTRPCLDFDLKLCSAPCTGNTTEQEYAENVANALLFLEGKTERLNAALREKMKAAAEREDFERAAHWRDLIRTIEQVKERPRLISVALENADIVGFTRQPEKAAVFIFVMRKGRVVETEEMIVPLKLKDRNDEALTAVLLEFYRENRDLPDKMFLPFEPARKQALLDKLSRPQGGKITIHVPLRGRYKKLAALATRNAETLFREKQEDQVPLDEVRKIFGLKEPPRRIEGFDISNTGGMESVGSLVVFQDGSPKKEEYRKYRIRTVKGPNDTAGLQEVIRRRYARRLEEKGPLPDLILVDGGKGQLHAALAALRETGLEAIPVISLAKREEIVHSPGQKEGIRLNRTSPALKLFQSIRDEAHRFAVVFHRHRREKKSFASLLDGVPGLGEKRKKALLAAFRSVEKIKAAQIEELAKVVGFKAAGALKNKLQA